MSFNIKDFPKNNKKSTLVISRESFLMRGCWKKLNYEKFKLLVIKVSKDTVGDKPFSLCLLLLFFGYLFHSFAFEPEKKTFQLNVLSYAKHVCGQNKVTHTQNEMKFIKKFKSVCLIFVFHTTKVKLHGIKTRTE